MNHKPKEDTIGSWSVQKLKLLEKYLAAYVKVLARQDWCRGYEYIDAFAGTGKPKTKDEEKYVDGSPRIALDLGMPFTKYHFVEQSDWRVKELEKLKLEFEDRNIEIYPGDCNEVLREKILPGLPYGSNKRAIAFLDPFGMELQWKTMKDIANVETVEIILNFPTMAINREILRRNPEKIPESKKQKMSQFWGTENWTVDLYDEEQTLFGPELVRKKQTGKEFGLVFKNRLSQIFKHCTSPVLMTNSNSAPLYCIMFAGHNATGAKIADQILKKYEKTGT
ncbi:MAG: three-Cys-motif partner protein TcmP [Elusimicrobia bacterium]|nr:three-Cys-motif partner protein TcmP [Elusimicrobiota bacterium]MBI4217664.1 three-Cys-motif partner protein TcmP [Elusimicrobiota bacterium]